MRFVDKSNQKGKNDFSYKNIKIQATIVNLDV